MQSIHQLKKNKITHYIIWALRILISVLFIISAISKCLSPEGKDVIVHFERQLVDLKICDWCIAPYLARFIIALEAAIGIAILIPHFLKSVTIPGTILLLLAFIIHLFMVINTYGNKGNCGCFGEWIKMTPLEAVLKNVLTIFILIAIYLFVDQNPKGQNKLYFHIIAFLAFSLLMFSYFTITPCTKSNAVAAPAIQDTIVVEDSAVPVAVVKKDSVIREKKKDTVKEEKQPLKKVSKFTNYNLFSGNKIDLNKGKKILCFFDPDCDHCMASAKQLFALQKAGKIGEILIYFLAGNDDKIPNFFEKSQGKAKYMILDGSTFFPLMNDPPVFRNTPGVAYLWNGNVMGFWEGTSTNEFSSGKLMEVYTKPAK